METGYQPIKMKRTFEVITDLLKEKIFSGEYEPGDRLPPERELSQMIEVSRSAVREAYHALEMLGIVEVRRGTEGGAFIKEPTHRPITQSIGDLLRLQKIRIEDMTEARLFLEKDLAVLAIQRVREEDLKKLGDWIDMAFDKIKAGIPAHEENVRFHIQLSEISRNPLLTMVYTSLMDLFLLILKMLPADLEASRIIAEEHREVISLLRAGHTDRLLDFLDHHIQGSNNRLVSFSENIRFSAQA
jgi:GntR family transcriptional repressor for pyruvate dehydrogenase complex